MTDQAPIFIVGAPRSGTTLLAAMISAHSRMSCGPETHFFRRLAEIEPISIIEPTTWPTPAVDFVSSISHSNFSSKQRTPLLDKYQIDRSQVYTYLDSKPPAISSVLASVTESYMLMHQKQRWVEKTPDHIMCLPAIRKYFPNSPIIRILRDPRDMALSLAKVPWGTNSLIEGILYWQKLDRTSFEFFSNDTMSYTVRFESLVESPLITLQEICSFLGEEFEESMMDTSDSAKGLNTRNVPWKQKARSPLDPSRAAVWMKELSERENQLAEALIGDRLEAYGYQRVADFEHYGELLPEARYAVKYESAIAEIANSGVRFWKETQDENPSVSFFLGDPGEIAWTQDEQSKGFSEFIAMMGCLMRARLSNHQVFWLSEFQDEKWTGVFAYFLKKLMRSYKISPESLGEPDQQPI